MICPKCNTEYREGFYRCMDCGVDLVDKPIDASSRSDAGNWFFRLGRMSAQNAVTLLFYAGFIPLLYSAILFGGNLYFTNKYMKAVWFIQNGQNTYTEQEVNNLPLGVFGGIALFIVSLLVWKAACELLIIIFRAIETYIQKNKAQ